MHPRKQLLVVALIVFSLASAARTAQAQNGRCPAVRKGDQYELDAVARVVESVERSDTRKYLKIDRVPPTAVKRLVVDDSVCQALYRATARAFAEVEALCADSACRTTKHIKPWEAERKLAAANLYYYRVGDCYAVLWSLPRGNEYDPLFIFRVPASQGGHDDLMDRILQALGLRDPRDLKFLGSTLL